MKIIDVEKMARDLMKDPAAKTLLENEFRKLLGDKVGSNSSDKELNKIYEKLKDNFEHIITPIGSKEDDKD
jgi:hypothetical protein